MAESLTRNELMSWLRYEPETGLFYWRAAPARRCSVGAEAGHKNGQGYREIELRGKVYQAHRIAWLFETGEWPEFEVDHKNGVRDDNRIDNLRAATKSQNQHNRKQWSRPKSSKFKGVSWHKASQKWLANIQHENKRIHLGLFDTEIAAHHAYVDAANRPHGEFARPN